MSSIKTLLLNLHKYRKWKLCYCVTNFIWFLSTKHVPLNAFVIPLGWVTDLTIVPTANSRIIVNREMRRKNETLRWSYLLPVLYRRAIDRSYNLAHCTSTIPYGRHPYMPPPGSYIPKSAHKMTLCAQVMTKARGGLSTIRAVDAVDGFSYQLKRRRIKKANA